MSIRAYQRQPICHLMQTKGRAAYMRAYRRLNRERIAAQKREHREEMRRLYERMGWVA